MTDSIARRREQYARQLSKVSMKTGQEVEADPRRQASQEADEGYAGHAAGIHPENRPFDSQELTRSSVSKRIATANTPAPKHFDADGEYELEEDPRYYDTRLPTSTRRYTVSPEEMYQQGNTRYHVRYVDVPPRKSRQSLLPLERERNREANEGTPQRGQRTRFHPLVWIGWFGLNAFTNWYQGVHDDLTYGKQRHFEINAVVGHSDSPTSPSHFTAENNNGQIIVIELPGGNVNKARIYQFETVPGNVGNPPVKLSFQDMNGDGKPDMIVQIGDGVAMIYVTLFNNGSEFVSKL